MIGYTDVGYQLDPHNGRSQTRFVFLQNGTTISWTSSKQTLATTSTNHSKIIILYEASRECVWLRRMINHIQQSCGLKAIIAPTIIYEDNTGCVTQMETGYIKSNINKHISPKLFYPHELQQNGEIDILKTKSCDNLADLFTKSLPTSSFEKYTKELVCDDLGTCKFQGEKSLRNWPVYTIILYSFLSMSFSSQGFS